MDNVIDLENKKKAKEHSQAYLEAYLAGLLAGQSGIAFPEKHCFLCKAVEFIIREGRDKIKLCLKCEGFFNSVK